MRKKLEKMDDKVERKPTFVKKLSKVFQQAEKRGISREDIRNIFIKSNDESKKLKNVSSKGDKSSKTSNRAHSEETKVNEKMPSKQFGLSPEKYMYVGMFLLGALSTITSYHTYDFVMATLEEKCLVFSNEYTYEAARPLVQCSMCRNLDSVAVEYGISADEFKRKYAYSSVPVLVKDATSRWSAMSLFSFQYFKELYLGTEGALTAVEEECQFFPYSSGFSSLGDALKMPEKRANFTEGEKPWYIGWSNCHNEVKSTLRRHYERPYFLPNNSESSTLDWIFMGGSGPGADTHIDYVQRPSWQAQISGMKTWTLLPPPECETECKGFNVTVHKGDILVVNTNVWYHATFVHPGEISIGIGSEFD